MLEKIEQTILYMAMLLIMGFMARDSESHEPNFFAMALEKMVIRKTCFGTGICPYSHTGIYRLIGADFKSGSNDVGPKTRDKRIDIPRNATSNQWFGTGLISRSWIEMEVK